MWLRNYEVARDSAQTVMEFAEVYGFQIWSAIGSSPAWCRPCHQRRRDSRGYCVDRTRAEGVSRPQNPSGLLADASASLCGRLWRSLKTTGWVFLLDEAIASEKGSSSFSDSLTAEFLILKGDLLLALSSDNTVDAESLYQSAVNRAREVGAAMVEHRRRRD